MELKVALVGVGSMGGAHFFNWQNIENVKIIALCDIRPEQILDKGIAKTYTDFYEMLNKEQPDIIDICTPSYLHKEMSVAAMEMGFNVVCEKPAALSSKDISEMLAVAERNNVTFMVAQVLRFWHEYNVLRDIYNHQRYGKLVSANLWRHSGAPFWDWENWMSNEDRSGLVPFDLHIHDLDYCVSLLGLPDDVSAVRTSRFEDTARKKNLIDEYKAIYTFGDIKISMDAAWYNRSFAFDFGFTFVFEQAIVENKNGSMIIYPNDKTEGIPVEEEKSSAEVAANLNSTNGYYNELKYFAEQVRSGVKGSLIAGDELIGVLETIEKGLKQTDCNIGKQ